jgi:hypothetical protein
MVCVHLFLVLVPLNFLAYVISRRDYSRAPEWNRL